MPPRYFALVPAAGGGRRFGSPQPKQYATIAGQTVLRHAVAALLAVDCIQTVYVTLAPDDDWFRAHEPGGWGDRVRMLQCGGASRRDTVLNTLGAIGAHLQSDDWILVHDAARPCLASRDVARLIESVDDDAGGLLAVPVADTLKRAVESGNSAGDSVFRAWSTESREGLWQAQTPQLFRYGVLLRALTNAPHVTDEAGAVEALGLKPRLVEGSPRNIKVTYPSDLELASLILDSRSL